MKQTYMNFLEYSSVPGLRMFNKSSHIVVKLIWFLIIAVLLGLSIFFIIDNSHGYLKQEFITNIDIVHEETSEFPAISFCMMIDSKKYNKTPAINEVIVYCLFEDENCKNDFEIFEERLFNFVCYRFNSGKNKWNQTIAIKNSTTESVIPGLYLVLNLEKFKLIEPFFNEAKLLYYVNNPSAMFKNMLQLHFGENINALPKGVNGIKIEREFWHRLGDPYNRCETQKTTKKISKFFQHFIHNKITYVQSDCLDLCTVENL